MNISATVPDAPSVTAVYFEKKWVEMEWVPTKCDNGDPVINQRLEVLSARTGRVVTVVEAIARGQTSHKLKSKGLLEPGLEYTFRVQAQNGSGFGVFSKALSFQLPSTLPDKVKEVKFKSATTSSLTLKWRPPLSDGGSSVVVYEYQLLEAVFGDKAPSNQLSLDLGLTSFCDGTKLSITSGLRAGQAYFFRVLATTSVGKGPVSEWVLCATEAEVETDTPIPKLQGLRRVDHGPTTLAFEWTANKMDESFYRGEIRVGHEVGVFWIELFGEGYFCI